MEIWGGESVLKCPRNREMFGKRCECVRERECESAVRVCGCCGARGSESFFLWFLFFAGAAAYVAAYIDVRKL